jgi:cytochrome c peroxidase
MSGRIFVLVLVAAASALFGCATPQAPSTATTATPAPASPAAEAPPVQPVPLGEVALRPGDDEPLQPLPTVEELMESLELDGTPERIELGRRLFHDTLLSGDRTVSCATCHDLRFGGIDRSPRAVGIRGQVGPVNTPTVFNAALGIAQFWDGRAKDLAAQAEGPPQAAGEMGSNFEEISASLAADPTYVDAFRRAYPGEVNSGADIGRERIVGAIATYEATLLTPSRFDRWLGGDEKAMTREELAGYALFKEVGCAQCHYGPAVGGKTFQRLGAKHDFFLGRHISAADHGRFNVTKDERDRHMFKVPSLRNIEITGPYFHDGSITKLEDAVRTMAHYQLGVDLDDTQVASLVTFLKSLTGTFEGRPLTQAFAAR